MENDNFIICVGYSRLPDGISTKEVFGILGIILEINPSTGEIVDADATVLTSLAKKFIVSVLIGHNISQNGMDEPISHIERRYFGTGKKSLIHALRDAYDKYKEWSACQEHPDSPISMP